MNVEGIADLPTEPGLYQVVDPETPIHHEVTFRVMEDGQWVDVLDNVPVSLSRLATLGAHHAAGRLVSLIRDEPSRLVKASAERREPSTDEKLDRAVQIVVDLGRLRCVQSEMTDRYPAVSFTGLDHPLWAKAQERIDSLSRELGELL